MIAMIGTSAVTVAVVAVIEPDAALIVAIVMRVAGSDPDAAGTNIDLLRKCGCGENKERGGDCGALACGMRPSAPAAMAEAR
jgi:hypothetical protein